MERLRRLGRPMHYALLCAWGACVFLAVLGYGKLLLRAIQVRDAPWALSVAVGVGFWVAAGGVLNRLQLVTQPMLIGAVAVGVAFALLVDWQQLASFRASLAGTPKLYAPLIISLAVPVLGNVRADIQSFRYWDDLAAYLTIPQATIQLGSMPLDPFNERRITSSLGAPYVLQTVMLVVGDVLSIRFIDISLGFILYAGLLVAIARLMGLSVPIRIGLAFLALLVPVDRWNATMVVMPAALFCALFLIQTHPALGDRLGWRRAVLLGMIAAAVSCMKSTYLPAAVMVCALYYLAWLIYLRRAVPLFSGLLCGAVLLSCMLPWMVDMRQKEGTFLFPVLGRGYDASAYGIIPLPNGSHDRAGSAALWVWLTALPMAVPLLVALSAIVIAFRKRVESPWIASLSALLLGSVFGIAAVSSSTGSEAMGRYTLPFLVPALLVFLAFVCACQRSLRSRPWWLLSSGITTALALVVSAFVFGVRHGGYDKYLEDARLTNSFGEPWFDIHAEERRVRNLQAHVPPGARILARLFVTYPFDFKRNQIFVADYSGMAGLPPGMPLDGNPETMRSYLLSRHIRYLAFDPTRTILLDDDPGTSLQMLLHGGKDYGRHGWLFLQVKVADTVQHTFAALAPRSRHIFDDGTVYVLDLQAAS